MARRTGCNRRIIYRQTSGNGSLKSLPTATRDISGQSDMTLLCRFVEADALAERAAKELRKHPVVDGKPSRVAVGAGKIRARFGGTVGAAAVGTDRVESMPRRLGRQHPRLTVNPWEWNADDARR